MNIEKKVQLRFNQNYTNVIIVFIINYKILLPVVKNISVNI